MREEEKKPSSRKLNMKRFFKKKWIFPAVYIAAAAILLTVFLWSQNRAQTPEEFGYEPNPDRQMSENDALEVSKSVEQFKWPVTDVDAVEVKTPFYDSTATKEEQEAAIIDYGNSFQPNTGIDIVAKNGETFDVVASMSGTVNRVEEDSFLGNVIVIDHGNGIETRYQSVKDIQVSVGDKVSQGQMLAKAGRSLLNEEAGVHTHFEIRKNNIPVNPLNYFEKSLETLEKDQLDTSSDNGNEEADEAEEQENIDNNNPNNVVDN
ncbi:M23 family metallopeptidase [Fervidibacillus halotolerans]|uniref:M23 family metallopeptidase n=1 Tax=Fervidibacillus halotolerans TaxID=2980027 RepID=A0A9E8LZA0_9BACI|nr:M23 family metallopeptidase [Fervidibacillus halotolerans]WAA12157.1 M23 family metallopeptidase [Fervidibacillus halotolerans]